MKSAGEATLQLHLHSGIPVVTVLGIWDDMTENLLHQTVERLQNAGHLEIILNIAQVARLPHPERRWLDSLERIASALRARFGRLELVGTPAQWSACAHWQACSRLVWALSEIEAICRIKSVPMAISSERVSLRLR